MYCATPGVYTGRYSICVHPQCALVDGVISECYSSICLDIVSQPIFKIHEHRENCVLYHVDENFDSEILCNQNATYYLGTNMILHTVFMMFVDFKTGCKTRSRSHGSKVARIPDVKYQQAGRALILTGLQTFFYGCLWEILKFSQNFLPKP